MRVAVFFVLLIVFGWPQESSAQGRKLPNISFEAKTTEYAHANRAYNDKNQYVDTLHDDRIVAALAKILTDNPELVINLVGHTSMAEDTLLGMQRADRVRTELIGLGVAAERLHVINKGFSEPIIGRDVWFKLESKQEREAADQKNRRVEVKVAGTTEP